jgi:predicted dehydrogenase
MAYEQVKLAFLGFRHGHVMGIYAAARTHPQVKIVAAAEDHPETAAMLKREGKVELTHSDWPEVLERVPCDAVVVGDYFARRGEIIIAALKAGKHVLSDKPICTRLDQLDEIERLAREKSRVVSAQLDLRDSGAFITARKLIRDGAIGEMVTINFTAQHPLFLDKRPRWYFEPGKQGGTINDIAIHATDLIPWMTGRQLSEVVAARAWNARLPQFPHFQDAAQFMLKLDNGGGVFGDVSYLAPDGIGYNAPQYWRVTFHGTGGVIEARYGAKSVELIRASDTSVQIIPAEPDVEAGRLHAFLRAVDGDVREGDLTASEVVTATRCALVLQGAADQQKAGVCLAPSHRYSGEREPTRGCGERG